MPEPCFTKAVPFAAISTAHGKESRVGMKPTGAEIVTVTVAVVCASDMDVKVLVMVVVIKLTSVFVVLVNRNEVGL